MVTEYQLLLVLSWKSIASFFIILIYGKAASVFLPSCKPTNRDNVERQIFSLRYDTAEFYHFTNLDAFSHSLLTGALIAGGEVIRTCFFHDLLIAALDAFMDAATINFHSIEDHELAVAVYMHGKVFER